jgi:hypothetical protein
MKNKKVCIKDKIDGVMYRIAVKEKWSKIEALVCIDALNKHLLNLLTRFPIEPDGQLTTRVNKLLQDIFREKISAGDIARLMINLIRYTTGRNNDLCFYKRKYEANNQKEKKHTPLEPPLDNVEILARIDNKKYPEGRWKKTG